jgi:ligand-binding sensor domain-containing protein
LPAGDPARATRLDPAENEGPRSFVKKVVSFQNHEVLGTFADGLLRARTTNEQLASTPSRAFDVEDTHAPFRMVNDMLVVRDALLVAANEGLFATRDGTKWSRVELSGAHGVTGLAMLGNDLYATSTAALWRLDPHDYKVEGNWWRPAGTKSLQAITASGAMLYLASEDRGVIAYDGHRFSAIDKLSGLPTSWVVDVAGDSHGGAWVATLRDGVLHVNKDGSWSKLQGLSTDWISSVSVSDEKVCVGTQAGAACYEDPTRAPIELVGLPDRRAHAIARVGNAWLVGTEAGVALYPDKPFGA